MCRYGSKSYRPHFVCFDCRKTFKKVRVEDYIAQRGRGGVYERLMRYVSGSEKARDLKLRFGAEMEKMKADYNAIIGVCPLCGTSMASMGMDFRAPPTDDKNAWTIARKLYDNGFSFQSCGCEVGFTPPAKISGLKDFFRSHSRLTEGERLLEKIAAKSRAA